MLFGGYSLLIFLVAVLATEDLSLRIRKTQDLLLQQGPTGFVLDQYDLLIADLELAEDKFDGTVMAQVYYKKALVELSLNKLLPAVADLMKTLDYDPSLTPASSKLVELLLERGQFEEISLRFSPREYPGVFAKIEAWTQKFKLVELFLSSDNPLVHADKCLQILDLELIPVTPLLPSVYELHLRCSKLKLRPLLAAGDDSVHLHFKNVIGDYSKLLKVQPQKNLQLYTEFSQYALFTENLFLESWNVVKGCLRIDNDFKSCGDLLKTYSRLQAILKPLEEYSQVTEMLYYVTEDLGNKVDALEMDDLDYGYIYDKLVGTVTIPKKEAKKLPKDVKTTYGYLLWKAQQFSILELQNESVATSLKFVEDLQKFACESGVRSGHPKNKFCSTINEKNGLFLPKHLARIDDLLRRKKYAEAKDFLQKFSKNVQRTALYKERWSVIERVQQQQQQQQQQQYFHRQQQQRQRQQQQQQQQQQQRQQQHDLTKDYYKILDIPKDADQKTIKKGYRTQTLKYHPDKYKGKDLSEKEIETKMQEINEAYEVLSDAESKADYDNRGRSNQGGRARQGGGTHFANAQFNPQDFFRQQGFRFQF